MNEKVQYATKKPRYIVEMCRALEGVVSEVRSGADWQRDRSGCSFAVFPDDRRNHSILSERDEVQDLKQKCLLLRKDVNVQSTYKLYVGLCIGFKLQLIISCSCQVKQICQTLSVIFILPIYRIIAT